MGNPGDALASLGILKGGIHMAMKVIARDKLCGITVVSVIVNLRKHYAVYIFMDEKGFINADVQTDDLHEIIRSEESLEGLFPGIMKLVA